MNWADWTIVVILGISSLIGLARGLVKESLSLVVWAAAFFVAMHFRQSFASLLENHIALASVRELVAFGVLFVLTLLVGSMINYVIGQIVKATGLSGTDRVLGMVFGAARGVLIVMAIIIFLPPFIPIDKDNWWHQSVLLPHFIALKEEARVVFTAIGNLYFRLLN